MASGFMSEHSAEFAVAYSASRMARAAGLQMSPVYYWRTREGARHARVLCGQSTVQALSVFARRPKTGGRLRDGDVLVKFNEVLFKSALGAGSVGIPTMAACPLVTSLAEYRIDVPCAWFPIDGSAPAEDREWVMSARGASTRGPPPCGVRGPLSEEDVIGALRASVQGTYEELQQRIDESRARVPRGIFGSLYKPMTLLFWGTGIRLDPGPPGAFQ